MELVVYLQDESDLVILESSFGDPVEWQREIRQDRVLPFREA